MPFWDDAMIKFTDADPAKTKPAAPKGDAKDAAKSPAPQTAAAPAAAGARKTPTKPKKGAVA